MAISIGQVTVPTSGSASAVHICDVPPGGTAILSSTQTSADVFLGTDNSVTSGDGAPLDTAGPTTIPNPVTGAYFSLYGVAGTGTHVVGYIVVTPR